MFDGVARRYDITNTVLSLGQDRFWRRQTRAALGIRSPPAISSIIASTMRRWLDRLRSRRPSTRAGAGLGLIVFCSPIVICPPLARFSAGVNGHAKAGCAVRNIMTHIVP